MNAIFRWALALLAPQDCVVCGKWVRREDLRPLCEACQEAFPEMPNRVCRRCGVPVPGNVLQEHAICLECRRDPPPFDAARAAGPYIQGLREAVRAYKFQGLKPLARPLAERLEKAWPREEWMADYLVPVPSHPRRVAERGFDHTRFLSEELARLGGIPVLGALKRVRHTLHQTGLGGAERRRNLRGAFRLALLDQVRGTRVLLVDDIFTTGTTIREACGVLRGASPAAVFVLTCARVPLRFGGGEISRGAAQKTGKPR